MHAIPVGHLMVLSMVLKTAALHSGKDENQEGAFSACVWTLCLSFICLPSVPLLLPNPQPSLHRLLFIYFYLHYIFTFYFSIAFTWNNLNLSNFVPLNVLNVALINCCKQWIKWHCGSAEHFSIFTLIVLGPALWLLWFSFTPLITPASSHSRQLFSATKNTLYTTCLCSGICNFSVLYHYEQIIKACEFDLVFLSELTNTHIVHWFCWYWAYVMKLSVQTACFSLTF